MGGTTGMSQPPNAASGATWCVVNALTGTATAVQRPMSVPLSHSTEAMAIATDRPTTGCPTRRAPAPTVMSAMAGAP